MTPLTYFCILFLASLVPNLHAKFEASSFTFPRYEGVPKMSKVGHVTPSRSPFT